MRLLILTQYFRPEVGAPQTRLWAMVKQLQRMGHQVEVVTAMPNYPTGRIFPEYRNQFYRRDAAHGTSIHRTWCYPALGGGFPRIINYCSFMLTSILGLLRSQKPDYIFVESPPLLLSLPAFLFSRAWRVPFIFNVADLWPDSVIEKGFMKSKFWIRILQKLERWSYERAAFVNAMTETMRETLLDQKKVPVHKLLFLPNGVDTSFFRPFPPDHDLKRNLGLEGKNIVLYAGTQGYAHGLEHVLQAAKLLEGHPEIHFLFVGNGSARASLEELRTKLNLQNVTFRDPVPMDRLPPYFSIATCGLSSLRAVDLFRGARPAKVFPILSSGKPMLFVGHGEGADLIEQAGAGVIVPPANPEALTQAVLRLVLNPAWASELGANGRKYVQENLEWEKLVGEWMQQLKNNSGPTQTLASLAEGGVEVS